jgi:hypothetical protein
MTIATVSQPRYIPNAAYFHRIAGSTVFVALDTVQFKGREWDRRNKIRVPQGDGWKWLTVPVRRAPRETVIDEIRIDYSTDWQKKHWRTLESSYKRAPFFHLYAAGLRAFYETRYDLIRDLNVDMTRYFCSCLGISTTITLASDLEAAGRSSELLANLCMAVGADTYWSGIAGWDYLDESKFSEAGVALRYQEYRHPVYEQVHGKPFLPNMGIVDLLFNCGPDSLDVLLSGNEIPSPEVCPADIGNISSGEKFALPGCPVERL